MRYEVKSAGGVVFCIHPDKIIKFLVLRHLRGHWGFPKGHTEQGESFKITALREIREETGNLHFNILAKLNYELRYTVIEGDKRRPKRVILYLTEIPYPPKIKINVKEHSEFTWALEKEAKELIHSNAQPAIDEALFRIKKIYKLDN